TPAIGDSTGGGLVCRNDSGGPNGASVWLRAQPDSRRRNVAALRFISRVQSHRRVVAQLPQHGGGPERPTPGDVPRKRKRTGRENLAQLRCVFAGCGAGGVIERLQPRADGNGRGFSKTRGE